MRTFNSIYLGIVVQNNDPEHRGRVKVWVPHVSTTVYSKWNQLKKDQTFSFPGSPGGENFSAIIEELKDSLPWAEYSSPILGASTIGYYNNRLDINSVSDAPLIFGQPGTNTTNTLTATNIDPEGKGGKPGALYEHHPVGDAFGNTAKINSQNVNQYSNNYKPSTYSNAAKGIFSVPNVGAHVWVFFRDGIPHYPVYFGTSFSQYDFESIFKSGDNTFPDYPGTFENKDKRAQPEINADTLTYRNKLVVNQRGAAIEIINTTDREAYKVTHFGGGYYELNNKFTALFNPQNFQLLTLKDKFETVNGHNNSYVARDWDNIVQGNHFLKIGNFNVEALDSWKKLMDTITSTGKTNPAAIEGVIKSTTSSMADAEKVTGYGGNSFEFVTKHKTISVGLSLNESPVYFANPAKPVILTTSVAPGYKGSTIFNTVEMLYVPDMPGGNYDIFANNKFNVKSGAGGASVQTIGQLKLSGEITDIRGYQVNIAGSQVNLNGGQIVNIDGDVVYLKSKGQVMVDSNLGVTSNVVIGGGLYVEGELTVNHITAPIEYQVTENTQIKAIGPVIDPGVPGSYASGWNIIGTTPTGIITLTIPGLGTKVCKITTGVMNFNVLGGGVLTIAQPHSHVFKNIPLTLYENNPANPVANKFQLAAKGRYIPDDKTAIAAEGRLDGRIQSVGIPPPSVYMVGKDGIPTNKPNGPGSNAIGPSVIPA